jgi:CelD/BcsL family acetyltransferase involved in cellulose biosynthesis
LTELAGRDAVRGYLLFMQGRPISYLCCPSQGEALLYEYVGYDPDFADHSPGVVLLHLALEQMFEERRFAMFDFTEGEGPQKELFANRSQLCADLYFFRRSARNLSALYLHHGLASLSRRITAMLDNLGIKERLKKLIRSKA